MHPHLNSKMCCLGLYIATRHGCPGVKHLFVKSVRSQIKVVSGYSHHSQLSVVKTSQSGCTQTPFALAFRMPKRRVKSTQRGFRVRTSSVSTADQELSEKKGPQCTGPIFSGPPSDFAKFSFRFP